MNGDVDLRYAVAIASFAATFVGFATAPEQKSRFVQGSFGAAAGSALGGVLTIHAKDPQYLVWSGLGAALGALGGWLLHFVVCIAAGNERMRRVLHYMYGGLETVRNDVERYNTLRLIEVQRMWADNFRMMMLLQCDSCVRLSKNADRDEVIQTALRVWLSSVVEATKVIFVHIFRHRNYELRASILVYGIYDGKVAGTHWLSASGDRPHHNDAQKFDDSSYGYRVVEEKRHRFVLESEAQKGGQPRPGSSKYYGTHIFPIKGHDAILCIDWPEKIDEDDPVVETVCSLFKNEMSHQAGTLLSLMTIAPAIAAGLNEQLPARNRKARCETPTVP